MPTMKRFLQIAALFLVTLLAVGAAEPKRPNILFAIGDDISWPHMSAYGCTFVRTPAFDRVAREGVLFQNCFTSNPKCSPSRAALLTGKHTWQLEEACDHFGIFPSKFKVYPDLLEEQAGYHVGYTGKPWGPGDWKRSGRTRNPAGPMYSEFKLEPPTSGINALDYTKNFAAFLKARKPGQPFCFWYGGFEPHRPYEAGSGLRAGKKLSDVQVPAFLPDDEIVRNDLLDYALEIEWFDKHLGQMLKLLEEAGELENTLVVVTADNGMPFPRVKGNPYEMGHHLPLAIRWGAKIKPGRVVTDFISFTDMAPTFLEAVGLKPDPQMTGHSFMDVLLSPKSGRVNSARNFVVTGRERHDIGRPNDQGYPIRVLRTDDYLYLHNFKSDRWPAANPETGYKDIDNSPTKRFILSEHEKGESKYWDLAMGMRPEEELYKISSDRDCVKNLAGDSAYTKVKEKMWKDLQKFLKEQKDPRILGNGDVFDRYEYTGPRNGLPKPALPNQVPLP
ncbi:MAG: arylsulfatase family protein [Pedosphaera sp.]|nr:arylsulfatase family protein [Pedosphaera sp.]